MREFTVRTPAQLPGLLQGFRKQAGLTQADAALRFGIAQQSYSAMERNAEKMSAQRLLHLLAMLGVELVMREKDPGPVLSEPLASDW